LRTTATFIIHIHTPLVLFFLREEGGAAIELPIAFTRHVFLPASRMKVNHCFPKVNREINMWMRALQGHIQPDGKERRALVYKNGRLLPACNESDYFAIAVGNPADQRVGR
jgi:hypothetical protein